MEEYSQYQNFKELCSEDFENYRDELCSPWTTNLQKLRDAYAAALEIATSKVEQVKALRDDVRDYKAESKKNVEPDYERELHELQVQDLQSKITARERFIEKRDDKIATLESEKNKLSLLIDSQLERIKYLEKFISDSALTLNGPNDKNLADKFRLYHEAELKRQANNNKK